MDMESAKSDVNGQRQKYGCCYFVLKSDKNPQKMFQKRIDPIYIESD